MFLLAIVSLGGFYLVELLRAAPFPLSWLRRKPLSCNVCMSGWFGIAAGPLFSFFERPLNAGLMAAASAALVLFLLGLHERLAPKTPTSWDDGRPV